MCSESPAPLPRPHLPQIPTIRTTPRPPRREQESFPATALGVLPTPLPNMHSLTLTAVRYGSDTCDEQESWVMSRLFGSTGSGLGETAPECVLPTTWVNVDTYPRGFLQESVNRTGPARYLD